MANQWLRLWHDMPTDPKWRTISKASGQRIGDVMSVYLHILVCASNATERGRTHSFNCEDVASSLDLETEQVALIHAAMQGRVLDVDVVMGWEKRQPVREDGAAERAKAWRDAAKAKSLEQPNASERNQTLDKEKSREEKEEKKPTAAPWLTVPELVADGLSQTLSADWLAHRRTRKAKLTRLAWDGFKAEVQKAGWQLDDAIRKAISRNWTAFEAEWVKPAGFQAVAAVTVPSIAADKTAELLRADEEHRAEVARQRAMRQQEKAA